MKTANKHDRHDPAPDGGGLVLVPTSLGYARVSTEDQSLDVQLSALRLAGVLEENMYVEKISAVNRHRPQFRAMMKQIQAGDTVHVHALSRLGRDSGQIRDILKAIKDAGARWKSWTEPHLDSATAAGRLMINVTGAMAQFERDQIIERTKRGMDECRRKGMSLGRKRRIMPADIREMKRLRKGGMTAPTIAARFKCAVGTVYSYT
jgi:DNA invertase Pin-like site-specific DNA recombinase